MRRINLKYSNNAYDSYQKTTSNSKNQTIIASYYGIIKHYNDYFLIAKDIGKNSNFIIRPSIIDIYINGSVDIILDEKKSSRAEQIEQYLNQLSFKDSIKDINDIIYIFKNISLVDTLFPFLSIEHTLNATIIPHEDFERKNDIIKNCNESLLQLKEKTMELENNYKI